MINSLKSRLRAQENMLSSWKCGPRMFDSSHAMSTAVSQIITVLRTDTNYRESYRKFLGEGSVGLLEEDLCSGIVHCKCTNYP